MQVSSLVADQAEETTIAVLPLSSCARASARLPDAWSARRGLIGYNAPAYLAFIVPGPGDVRIGFEWGVSLPDPAGLLEGDGRQVRYVTIRTARALRSAALAELLRAAASRLP